MLAARRVLVTHLNNKITVSSLCPMRESQLSYPFLKNARKKISPLKDKRRIQQIMEGLPENSEEPGTKFQGSPRAKTVKQSNLRCFQPNFNHVFKKLSFEKIIFKISNMFLKFKFLKGHIVFKELRKINQNHCSKQLLLSNSNWRLKDIFMLL